MVWLEFELRTNLPLSWYTRLAFLEHCLADWPTHEHDRAANTTVTLTDHTDRFIVLQISSFFPPCYILSPSRCLNWRPNGELTGLRMHRTLPAFRPTNPKLLAGQRADGFSKALACCRCGGLLLKPYDERAKSCLLRSTTRPTDSSPSNFINPMRVLDLLDNTQQRSLNGGRSRAPFEVV